MVVGITASTVVVKDRSVPTIFNSRVMTALFIPLLRTFRQCHVVYRIAGRMYE